MKIEEKIIRYVKETNYSCGLNFPSYYYCKLRLTDINISIKELNLEIEGKTIEEVDDVINKFMIKNE